MTMRQDALCGAAEFVNAVERLAASGVTGLVATGLVATVGQLSVEPGASNVIPGVVALSLDVRHARDARRVAAVRKLEAEARAIARRRRLTLIWTPVQESAAVRCDPALTRLLSASAARQLAPRGQEVISLPSGAGHDAVALSSICPVAMLFVRCKGGVSHHPDESVRRADVECAIGVMADVIRGLAARSA